MLAERALRWRRTLVIGDLHLGKAAAFRAGAIPAPRGTTRSDMARLAAAVARSGAERLIVAGDLLHARAGRDPETLAEFVRFRETHASLDVVLVRGNHDKRAGDPPAECRVACLDGPLHDPPFLFQHHPGEDARGYVLAGHMHPAVRLRGRGRQRLRLPCFCFGPRGGILPAFGEFTGNADIRPEADLRIYAIAGSEVVAV